MKKLILLIFLLQSVVSYAQFTPVHVETGTILFSSSAAGLKKDFWSVNQFKFQFIPVDQGLGNSQFFPTIGLGATDHLPGFFCKLEYKLEGRSKLAPRFRLGSLNYTEWMEGKGEWYNRYK